MNEWMPWLTTTSMGWAVLESLFAVWSCWRQQLGVKFLACPKVFIQLSECRGKRGPWKQLLSLSQAVISWVLDSLVIPFPCERFLCPWQSLLLGSWERMMSGKALGAAWPPSLVAPLDLEFEFQLSQEFFWAINIYLFDHLPPDYQGTRAHTRSMISYNVWPGFAGFHVLTCAFLSTLMGSSQWRQGPLRFCSCEECTQRQVTENGALNSLGLLFIFKWTLFLELF